MQTSATQRIDHRSEHGAWTLLRRRPPAALAGHVLEMQGYVEEGGRPVVRKEPPTGVIPMILTFGPGFTMRDPGSGAERDLGRSFVAGLWERPVLVGSAGRAFCMQVDFTIAGARLFLDLDMVEIAGLVVDLNQILGRETDLLEERLVEARGWETRFEILEAFLIRRLLGGRPLDRRVEAALRALDRTAGAVPVGGLARALEVSRKHLATLFRREIGLTPKALGRILRFETALERLGSGGARSLADLAAECGYADQAHFNRDFRAYAGESPTTLMRRFDRLTPVEQKYMFAMARLGAGPHRSGDIAAEMGPDVNSVAPHRSWLIRKGMVYSPAYGDTAFTVPMFDEYLGRVQAGMADCQPRLL